MSGLKGINLGIEGNRIICNCCWNSYTSDVDYTIHLRKYEQCAKYYHIYFGEIK